MTITGVQAWIPYEELGDVSELEGVRTVREPYMASPKGWAAAKGLFST